MAGRANRSGVAGPGLAAVVLAAPLLVFVAALGTRTGLWSYDAGHDLLAMRAGPAVAGLGALAALALLIMAVIRRASWRLALAAVVLSAATVGAYAWQVSRIASGPSDDISTDLAEVPGFGALDARRGGAGPGETAGVNPVPARGRP